MKKVSLTYGSLNNDYMHHNPMRSLLVFNFSPNTWSSALTLIQHVDARFSTHCAVMQRTSRTAFLRL